MRISDWSSDVCSSDLDGAPELQAEPPRPHHPHEAGPSEDESGEEQEVEEVAAPHDLDHGHVLAEQFGGGVDGGEAGAHREAAGHAELPSGERDAGNGHGG